MMFWDDVPKGYDWVGVDENKGIWAYKRCPFELGDYGEWEPQPEDYYEDDSPIYLTILPEFVQLDWRNSLVRRPR